jgi:hypothetical protein
MVALFRCEPQLPFFKLAKPLELMFLVFAIILPFRSPEIAEDVW